MRISVISVILTFTNILDTGQILLASTDNQTNSTKLDTSEMSKKSLNIIDSTSVNNKITTSRDTSGGNAQSNSGANIPKTGERPQEASTTVEWIECGLGSPNQDGDFMCYGTEFDNKMRVIANPERHLGYYVFGKAGNDRLLGGVLIESQNQNIHGEGGDDIIYGTNGNRGGEGLHGGEGNDIVKLSSGGYGGGATGQSGDDKLYGGRDGDHLEGNEGTDLLNGDDGDDMISGGNGADAIAGGSGNDIIFHKQDYYPPIPNMEASKVAVMPDGFVDKIDCGPGYDTVWASLRTDKDTILNCEKVHFDGDIFDQNAHDNDGDGISDVVDNCEQVSNKDQRDTDRDTIGDVCDNNKDNDSRDDLDDNCDFVSNEDQKDTDRDGLGDACDPDDDNDGIPDSQDNCRGVSNRDQADLDDDGIGDPCDVDDDGTPGRDPRFPEREETID